MSETARSRIEKQGSDRRITSKISWNNVFPELLIEVSELWSVLGSILAVFIVTCNRTFIK